MLVKDFLITVFCSRRDKTFRTCRRRQQEVLLKLLLTLCCIIGTHCEPLRGIKKLQAALNKERVPPPLFGHCDFEEKCQAWQWKEQFKIATPQSTRDARIRTDASNNPNGHFLRLKGPNEAELWSVPIPKTGAQCFLVLTTHSVHMDNGVIRLIIKTNDTSTLSEERRGDNSARWNVTRFKLGMISQTYRVGLEIGVPPNGSIAIDNIRLVDCFPESLPYDPRTSNCTNDMFRCNNGSCLNRTRICDLTPDCAEGEDETLECDKIPETARCTFENGWCGWTNAKDRKLQWTLHKGSAPSERTGPSYDHTYRNETGTYAFVNSSRSNDLGDQATLSSPVFNPTPPYSGDPNSPYYRSCQVRFFFHQYGTFSGSLGLYLVQKKHLEQSQRLWWSYGDNSDMWYNHVVSLPHIRYRWYLQFEASKGYAAKADVAIDDFSLSPECFGIGVPPDVVGDFNYYNPVIESEQQPKQHFDFMNETVLHVTTCGASGRRGPAPSDCAAEYNNSDSKSLISQLRAASFAIEDIPEGRGMTVQNWTSPSGGYYTLIASGARGGRGSGGMGSTLGATVRAVIELEKGQTLYFLVGQPGADACEKKLGKQNNTCTTSIGNESPATGMSSLLVAVKTLQVTHGGGGGGGGTFIFTKKENGKLEPLLVAAGGGGLGFGKFNDDGIQHGHGPYTGPGIHLDFAPTEKAGGAGGGWNSSATTDPLSLSVGRALLKGALGGRGCHQRNETFGYGDGGFGGGGGGCRTGGGGGGYIGGTTGYKSSSNGEGGYSYAAPDLLHTQFKEGANPGAGEIFIIPAIIGCGCDFRCVAVDHHLSETRCICPPGWQLGNNSRSCIPEESDTHHETFIMVLIVVCVIMFLALSGLCMILYNRYQSRKAQDERRQNMFHDGTELAALQTLTTETMMTEFNPNYEFAGNMYSIKDLPQIPRECITCVKPVGQGAFGEVFQGIYRYRGDEEAPVAVKTLPTITTSQAAADFMMEALIMSKFDHPNIVKFIGISFDKNPRYIVLELLAGGDLKNFLREERPRQDRDTSLTMEDLVVCAHDVAKGCKYMEDSRFIHRDIAARNCILTCKGPGRVVKIADFGMARDIYRSDYYRKGGKAMLPIKWMPPESFLDGIFTTKTDVWAFGVLLWEIMSFGYMPYTGCANREVMTMVTTGGRLEKPAGCPAPLYAIMASCWHPRPDNRPSFGSIVERLGYCLQDSDLMKHPMPNWSILPDGDREVTIMRPDPEAECININAELDGCGYMQPRSNFRPSAYRIGVVPGIVYASLRHPDDFEGEIIQETTLVHPKELEAQSENVRNTDTLSVSPEDSVHLNNEKNIDHRNEAELSPKKGENLPKNTQCNNINHLNDLNRSDSKSQAINGDSTTDTSDSLPQVTSVSSPLDDTSNSSPNTRNSSPSHVSTTNNNPNNVNGIIKKSALKATLSLDPSALYRPTIPYEKMAYSSSPAPLNNSEGTEINKKEPINHELPREEECSC